MPECPHGDMIPKAGFSFKSRRNYAGFFCPDEVKDCPPGWISESEIYQTWLDSVKSAAIGGTEDGSPPF
jgi:hypothetical protein